MDQSLICIKIILKKQERFQKQTLQEEVFQKEVQDIKHLVFSEFPQNMGEKAYRGILKIGKMSTSHIKLEGSDVARSQGFIEHVDGEFFLTITGSTKSILNQKELARHEKIKLRNADVLRMGSVECVMYLGNSPLKVPVSTRDFHQDISDSPKEEISHKVRVINPKETVKETIKKTVKKTIKEAEALVVESKQSKQSKQKTYFRETEDEEQIKHSIGHGIDIKQYWRGHLMRSGFFNHKKVMIGEQKEDDFYIDASLLPRASSFCLLEEGKVPKVQVLGSQIEYMEAGEYYSFEDLRKSQKFDFHENLGSMVLKYRSRIAFELGDYRFEIAHIPVYKKVRRSIFMPILDGLNLRFSLLSIFAHVLLMLIVYLIPPEVETFHLEKLNRVSELYQHVILEPAKKPKIKKEVQFEKKVAQKTEVQSQVASNGSAKNYSFESKHVGKQLSQRELEIKKIVHNSGLLVYKGRNQVLGQHSGFEDDVILLSDSTDITSTASGTPSIRGGASNGNGGNHASTASLGTGGPNTIGYTNRNPRAGIAMRSKKRVKRALVGKIGKTLITGNLTKQQIQRVVTKNISQIRYCYENELLSKPNLKGNITILWIITPQGKVKSVKVVGSTLKDKHVQTCILKRIKRWRFPEPKGGGYSKIKYPFNFRSN